MLHVEQVLLIIPEHISSSPVFNVVRAAQLFSVMLYRSLFVLCTCSFCHCFVCPSSIYASDYPFGILAIVLSVLRFTASVYPFGILAIVLSVLRFTASDYPFDILWPLCCLSFFDLRLLITPLVSWPLCCLFFFDLRLLITPLVSCGHCIVCPSSAYGF